MLDSIYHMTNTLKSHFWRKNVILLSLCTQRCHERHNVSRKFINQSSGLSILLHGVISLPDATSYDKRKYIIPSISGIFLSHSQNFKGNYYRKNNEIMCKIYNP